MKSKIRTKIIELINKIFLKIPDGMKYPDWILWLFFPIETYVMKKAKVYISYANNFIRLYDIEIPIKLLNEIKEDNKIATKYEVFYNFKLDKDNILKLYKSYVKEV